jgi:hypothetical protein
MTLDGDTITVAQLPRTGISVSAESDIAASVLESFVHTGHAERLPLHIRAALALREVLRSHIVPREEPEIFQVSPGASTVVLITVGAKKL